MVCNKSLNKENISFEERISRLEELFDYLKDCINNLYRLISMKTRPASIGIIKRDCDKALLLKGDSDNKAIIESERFGVVFDAPVFHAVDDDKTKRFCSWGYDDSSESFKVETVDDYGEFLGLEVKRNLVRLKGALREITTSYSDLVISDDGIIGIPASSKEAKENIRPLDINIKDILKVKPVVFNWKTDKTKRDIVGFLNEDLQENLGIKVHELISLVAFLWKAVLDLYEYWEQSSQNDEEV